MIQMQGYEYLLTVAFLMLGMVGGCPNRIEAQLKRYTALSYAPINTDADHLEFSIDAPELEK